MVSVVETCQFLAHGLHTVLKSTDGPSSKASPSLPSSTTHCLWKFHCLVPNRAESEEFQCKHALLILPYLSHHPKVLHLEHEGLGNMCRLAGSFSLFRQKGFHGVAIVGLEL